MLEYVNSTTPTDTMMALRSHTRGGPENLVWETAPMPDRKSVV